MNPTILLADLECNSLLTILWVPCVQLNIYTARFAALSGGSTLLGYR